MRQRKDVATLVRQERLIGIIRTPTAEEAEKTAWACIDGGMHLVEITLSVPGALHVIQTLSRLPHVCIGAGSVLDSEMARKAIAYGARYIISPHTDPEIIQVCEEEDIFVAAGALTPTEVMQAWNLGVDVVKIFPAKAVGGPEYIRALKAPLPFTELLPTGGVNLENCEAYLEAGVMAVGITDAIVNPEAVRAGEWRKISERARQFVTKLRRES
jgi:2-dehydro-3-deoxyphosphogluconate aldolase / (4S)-4-hydroxy-2-oxoglutarate aldolase